MTNEIYDKVKHAILEGEGEAAVRIANELIADPEVIGGAVEAAIATIREVGDQFEAGDVFLPEMIIRFKA